MIANVYMELPPGRSHGGSDRRYDSCGCVGGYFLERGVDGSHEGLAAGVDVPSCIWFITYPKPTRSVRVGEAERATRTRVTERGRTARRWEPGAEREAEPELLGEADARGRCRRTRPGAARATVGGGEDAATVDLADRRGVHPGDRARAPAMPFDDGSSHACSWRVFHMSS